MINELSYLNKRYGNGNYYVYIKFLNCEENIKAVVNTYFLQSTRPLYSLMQRNEFRLQFEMACNEFKLDVFRTEKYLTQFTCDAMLLKYRKTEEDKKTILDDIKDNDIPLGVVVDIYEGKRKQFQPSKNF